VSAHTKGPLRAVKQSIYAGDRHIGSSDSPYVSFEAANANAVLWAAAPDLLIAAERLSALAEQIWVRMSDAEMQAMRDAYAALDAAIAKATGQDGEK
jgi:hypothetical protein